MTFETDEHKPPLLTEEDPVRRRRKRRSRDDVLALIREAARTLFSQRGYGSTTTREIARLADVSETLVFRYFTDKASLFNQVVTAPFDDIMNDFVLRHADADPSGELDTAIRQFTRQVFELFEQNETIFRAILLGPADGDVGEVPSLRGLDPFFEESARQVERRYAKAKRKIPFDPRIAVRLALGMIAASVVIRAPLFGTIRPNREALIDALGGIVEQSLGGPH